MKKNESDNKTNKKEKKGLPGYPDYPADEDIYNKDKKVKDVNPEDESKIKESNDKRGKPSEKEIADILTGEDLDVPGSELDDEKEAIGSEDEENNYYSLGGDDHDDLEEDKGD